jgi:hypothetical protein
MCQQSEIMIKHVPTISNNDKTTGQFKNRMTLSGIERATFRLVE